MRNQALAAITAIALALLAGMLPLAIMRSCSAAPDADIVNRGERSLQPVQHFRRLFPAAESEIQYSDGRLGRPRWRSKALLNDRYILTLEFDLPSDISDDDLHPVSDPTVAIIEVVRIEKLFDGRYQIDYGDQHTVPLDRLSPSNGREPDWRSLGIDSTRPPVPFLNECWRSG